MTKGSRQGKWTFVVLWLIANTFGWGMFIIVAAAAGWVVWEAYNQDFLGPNILLLHNESNRVIISFVISSLCWGAIVGLLQQFILRRRFEIELKRWVLATTIGFLLYLAILYLAPFLVLVSRSPSPPLYVSYVSKFASPFALGIAQWFIFRKYFAKSGWWIVATAVALWLSHFAPSTYAMGDSGILLITAPILMEGLIFGIATLIALTVVSKQLIVVARKE